jgi:hypothetical protein
LSFKEKIGMGLRWITGFYLLCGGIFYLTAVQSANASLTKESGKVPVSRYDAVLSKIHKIAADHPESTRLFTLGISDSGQSIEGIAIGSGPVNQLVVATHHGNEYGSTAVATAFAATVAEKPIDGQTIYVVPVLNITGYNANQRWEKGSDPNRDYPGPCGTEGPFKLKSTAALANFVEQQRIVASATLHSYYPAVVYPWGIPTSDLSTPYDGLFKKLTTLAALDSGYRTGNSTEVIYPASGTFEDYAFWKHGIWSLLFELGYTHSPSETEMAELSRVNVPGLVRMMENAPKARAQEHGFKGECDRSLRARDRHDE